MVQFVLITAVAIASERVPVGVPAGPPKVRDLNDHIEVKLVGWKTSVARTQHKIAEFETIEKEPRRIELPFGPNSYTPHGATLMVLIQGVTEAPTAGAGWGRTRAGVEAVFSMPVTDGWRRPIRDKIERTYLVRLTFPKDK